MLNTYDERSDFLARLLFELVEALRVYQDTTWRVLCQTVNNNEAVIVLDDVCLALSATNGSDLKVEIQPEKMTDNLHFFTTADGLRSIISGQYTLDCAVNDGTIFVRAGLKNMLEIHSLVMHLLANGATKPELQKLWREFDASWPKGEKHSACYCLENQIPEFGNFVHHITPNVLLTKTDLL